MAEITPQLEQVQAFIKGLGCFEDDEINTIINTPATDLAPLFDKVKGNYRTLLEADADLIAKIQAPLKDSAIGKENQLKKEVRKTLGLNYTEDELKKMPFNDLLLKGIASKRDGDATETEKLRKDIIEWREKYEALESDVPNREKAVEDAWRAKLSERDIREEFIEIFAKETQVQRANIPKMVTAFLGYASQMNWKVSIDDKKQLALTDDKGNVVQNTAGHILKPKEAVKEFIEAVNPNVQNRGEAGPGGDGGSGGASAGEDLLKLVGEGLG